jgi:hypothetical protein
MDPYSDPIGAAVQGERGTPGRHASDWGLGSLLMSLTLLVLFPLVVSAACLVWIVNLQSNAREGTFVEPVMLITLSDVVAYGSVTLAGLAVLFGMVGLISGFVRNQPVGLPTTALVVGLVALILWIIMFIGIQGFKRELNYRGDPYRYQREKF